MFFNHVYTIRPRISTVNDDGKLRLVRKRHLVAEYFMLHFARGMIVEIVQADFAPGNYFGMLREPGQFIQVLLRYFFRFVRMDADGGINPIMLIGERQSPSLASLGPGRCRWLVGSNAGCTGADKHSVAIFRELRKVDVRVGVDEFHGPLGMMPL